MDITAKQNYLKDIVNLIYYLHQILKCANSVTEQRQWEISNMPRINGSGDWKPKGTEIETHYSNKLSVARSLLSKI